MLYLCGLVMAIGGGVTMLRGVSLTLDVYDAPKYSQASPPKELVIPTGYFN